MQIKDLLPGKYTLALNIRGRGVLRRLRGEVVEKKDEICFITHLSPKRSFAQNTRVTWHRKIKEVKETKTGKS